MDSSEQVAKLAEKSEMGQEIDRIRATAKLHHRGGVLAPRSKFKNETLKGEQPRPRATMSPSTFKKKYCKDLPKDLVM